MTFLGYADPAYASALHQLGVPRPLTNSGGWLLVRSNSEGLTDAMGPYPIFTCLDWRGIPDDFRALGDELVSVVLVTDPFAHEAVEVMETLAPDVLRPYKDHYVVDLTLPVEKMGRASRRGTAMRAARALDLSIEGAAGVDADEWTALYEHVIARHRVTGPAAFSSDSLNAQLAVPGALFASARHHGELVAAQFCLRQGEVVYSHLAASSAEGYRLRAMHALDLFVLESLASTASWFDFGGGGGAPGDAADGLSQYKSSWATGVRPTWLAGLVLNRQSYDAATILQGSPQDGYFPAYRRPQTAERTSRS